VTDLNGELLRPFTMHEAEEVFWTHEGRTIQGWIVKPPGFDPAERYPLFLFPHGGPFGVHVDGFHYRWNAQIFAAHGYVVFMPNPTGSTGFGERFAAEVQGAWGGRVFDEVMAGVDHLLATSPWLDGDRMVAGSASYGGYFMNWLITQTDRFKAVFTHASIWNFVSMTGASIISHFMLADASNRPPWEDFAAFNRYSPHYHAGEHPDAHVCEPRRPGRRRPRRPGHGAVLDAPAPRRREPVHLLPRRGAPHPEARQQPRVLPGDARLVREGILKLAAGSRQLGSRQ
jgi:dipeptidyl aminopeptidase/acylaminoacyl peptidase